MSKVKIFFLICLLKCSVALGTKVNFIELTLISLISNSRDQKAKKLIEDKTLEVEGSLFLNLLSTYNGLSNLGSKLSKDLDKIKSGKISRSELITLFKNYPNQDALLKFGKGFYDVDVFSDGKKINLSNEDVYSDIVDVFLRSIDQGLSLFFKGMSLDFKKLSTDGFEHKGEDVGALEAACANNLPITAEYLLNNFPNEFNKSRIFKGDYFHKKVFTLRGFSKLVKNYIPKKISLVLAKHDLDYEKIAPNKFEADFSFVDLEKMIKNSKGPDDFFQKLKNLHYDADKKVMQNFTFVHKTRSSQSHGVSTKFPRVIRFNKDASLVMAYVSNPKSKYANNLEIINFDHKEAKFNFYKADLSEGKIQENPRVCYVCHAEAKDKELRPIWPSYPDWPGVFGKNDDNLSKNEFLQYFEFKESNENNVRVTSLPYPESALKTDILNKFSYEGLSNSDEKINELLKITNRSPYIFYPYLIHAQNVEGFSDEGKTTANYNFRNNLKLNDFFGHLNALRMARVFSQNIEGLEKKIDVKNRELFKAGIMYEGFECQKYESYLEDLKKISAGESPQGFLQFFADELLNGIKESIAEGEFDGYVGITYRRPMVKNFKSLLTYTLSKIFGLSRFDWSLFKRSEFIKLEKDDKNNGVFFNYGLAGDKVKNNDTNIIVLLKSALTMRWSKADIELKPYTGNAEYYRAVANFFGYEFTHIDALGGILVLPDENKADVCKILYKRMERLSKSAH